MENFYKLIELSKRQNILIGISVKKIVWEYRHIGLVKSITENSILMKELNQYGLVQNEKNIKLKDIKYVEIGGDYLEDLLLLYKQKVFKKLTKSRFVRTLTSKRGLEKLGSLQNDRTICSFMLNENYVTGIIQSWSNDDILIKSVGFNGMEDGYCSLILDSITSIRFDGNFERKVSFLHQQKFQLKTPHLSFL